MIILGIETATQLCGVGLAGDEGLIADHRLSGKTIHAEHLPRAVETVLGDAGIPDESLDGIAVSIGPGSFTGLRIGLGLAKGMAFGLDKPLMAVPTMDGIVSQVPGCVEWTCVLLIARKGEAYRGIYRWTESSWSLAEPFGIVPEENIKVGLPTEKIMFLGEGALLFRNSILKQIDGAWFPPTMLHYSSGTTIAEKGRELLARGETADIDSLVPLYLKRFQGVA